ncbi:hypothetical protein Gpo141_00011797 [Globisporangium polare]
MVRQSGSEPELSRSNSESPPPFEQQSVEAANNLLGCEAEPVDAEEQNREKIAEVSRLLQEMGDDEDVDVECVLLPSDSSEDFLEIAELQRELHREHEESQEKEEEHNGRSSSSPSSSEEEASPLLHALPHSPAQDGEEDEEEAVRATPLELQPHGLLAQNEDENGVAVAASASAELLYDSDFTENENEENEDDKGDLAG